MAIKVEFANKTKLVGLNTLCEGDTFLYGGCLYIASKHCTEDRLSFMRIDNGASFDSQVPLPFYSMVEPVDITVKVEMK